MSKEKETGKEKRRIRQLARYYIPYKGLFFTDMFFAMLGAAITLVIPLIVRYITSTVVEKPLEQATGEIIRLGILMIAMVLVEMYCNFYIAYYGHVMGARIEHDMRNEIFGHYQKLSFAFFDNQKVGHLLSRITSDLYSWLIFICSMIVARLCSNLLYNKFTPFNPKPATLSACPRHTFFPCITTSLDMSFGMMY